MIIAKEFTSVNRFLKKVCEDVFCGEQTEIRGTKKEGLFLTDLLFPEITEIDEVGDGAEKPRDRIDPADEQDVVVRLTDREQDENADGTPADEHDDHGNYRLSEAAEDRGTYMRESEQTVEQGADPSAKHAVGDHLRILIERADQRRGEQERDQPDAFDDQNA